MRDRTRVAALAVVTVPLAWYALAHHGSDTPAGPAATHRPLALPVAAGPARTPVPAPTTGPPVVQRGSGSVTVVPGSGAPGGRGRVYRYTVAVEGGLGIDAADFAAQVQRTLADPRSWGHTGALTFQRVDSGPADLHVVLASPALTDRMCAPLKTQGRLSCGNGTTAVLNSYRWLDGADAYAGRLPEYRQYVVNHEVGHTIGHAHEQCRGPGQLAPVMMQQTKGVGACLPSPWPYP